MCGRLQYWNIHIHVYRVGQKPDCVWDFATFNGRKACNMSKVSKFCLEKEYHTLISEFKYSLLSLYKYSLSLHRASAEGTFKLFFQSFNGFGCCFKTWQNWPGTTIQGASYCDHIVEQGSFAVFQTMTSVSTGRTTDHATLRSHVAEFILLES